MSSQLFYFFTLVCVLSQTNAHFGTSGTDESLTGKTLRFKANLINSAANFADNAKSALHGIIQKKTPPYTSFSTQTGQVFQVTPSGTVQPPLSSYGSGVGIGGKFNGNIGYNIGIAQAGSYDSYRRYTSSGSIGGRIDVGASPSSLSGIFSDDDHLEYVSSTGLRRRLSNEEIIQFLIAIAESMKFPAGSGGFTGGYTGVPTSGHAGGSLGMSVGGYSGVPTGGYSGVPTGVYPGVTTGVATGVPTGVPTGVYPGVTTGVATGVYPGVATGVPTGVYPGAATGGYLGVAAGGYPGVAAGGYAGPTTGVSTGGSMGISVGGYTGVPVISPIVGPTIGGPTGGPTGGGPAVGPTGGGPAVGPTGRGPAGGPTGVSP